MDEVDQLIESLIAQGATDEDIMAIVGEWKTKHAAPLSEVERQEQAREGGNVFQNSTTENIVGGVKGAAKAAWNGVTALPGMLMNPLDTIESATNARYDAYNEGQADLAAGRTSEGVAKTIAGHIPFLGPAMVSAGKHLGSGSSEEMGQGALEAGSILSASPMVRSGVSSAAGAVGKVAGPTARAVGRQMGNVVRTVEESPVLAGGLGAAIGGLKGGWPGALEGAAGGGVVGSLGRVVKMMREGRGGGSTGRASKPEGELVNPDVDLEAEIRTELEKRINAMPNRNPESALPDVPFRAPDGDAPAWAPGVATQRPVAATSPNAGGRLGGRVEPRMPFENRLAQEIGGGGPDTVTIAPSHPQGGGFTVPSEGPNPNAGGRLGGRAPGSVPVESGIQQVLESLRKQDGAELAPSHPSGGGYTLPVENPNAGGRLVGSGGRATLDDALREALDQEITPPASSVEIAPSNPPGGEATTPPMIEDWRQEMYNRQGAKSAGGKAAKAATRQVRQVDTLVDEYKDARFRHGRAGFTAVPELPKGELERLQAAMDAIMKKRSSQ